MKAGVGFVGKVWILDKLRVVADKSLYKERVIEMYCPPMAGARIDPMEILLERA